MYMASGTFLWFTTAWLVARQLYFLAGKVWLVHRESSAYEFTCIWTNRGMFIIHVNHCHLVFSHLCLLRGLCGGVSWTRHYHDAISRYIYEPIVLPFFISLSFAFQFVMAVLVCTPTRQHHIITTSSFFFILLSSAIISTLTTYSYSMISKTIRKKFLLKTRRKQCK